MRQAAVILLMLLFSGLCKGQVPGYMGKRFTFQYALAAFPSLQPNQQYNAHDGTGGAAWGVNVRQDVAIDYVMSRSIAIGGAIKFVQTQMPHCYFYEPTPGNGNPLVFSGNVKLNGTAFSVFIKSFNFDKRGYLAPVGFYSQWELMFGTTHATAGSKEVPDQTESITLVNEIGDLNADLNQSYAGIILTVGKQNLLADRFIINTGASIGVTTDGIGIGIPHNYGTAQSFAGFRNHRLGGYYLFSIHLGIGLLAF